MHSFLADGESRFKSWPFGKAVRNGAKFNLHAR